MLLSEMSRISMERSNLKFILQLFLLHVNFDYRYKMGYVLWVSFVLLCHICTSQLSEMLLTVLTWIIGNTHNLVANKMGKAQHRGPTCRWTDIFKMYCKEAVNKELDELIWLRIAAYCGHEDESTANIQAISVVGSLVMFKRN